jgi:hypothetical protein
VTAGTVLAYYGRMKMKTLLQTLIFLALCWPATAQVAAPPVAQATAPTSKAGIGGLVPLDRLAIREAQLALAQAHIARLQAEAQVKSIEDGITQLINSYRAEYGCPGCILSNDFMWSKPEAAAAAAAPPAPALATPVPPVKQGGQTTTKE